MASPSSSSSQTPKFYKIKLTQYRRNKIPIVMQDKNGSCPLIAICNVLSLKNELGLSEDEREVSEEWLLGVVGDRLRKSTVIPDEEERQRVVRDVLDSLHKLTTGVDVDPIFTRIDGFVFEGVSRIFSLLRIPLYHGWIIHPMDYATQRAIGEKSYNVLLDQLAVLDGETTEEGERIKEFLQKQLTMTGLQYMRETLEHSEPCVFYWDKHFYTLVNEWSEGLFTLLTDEGFLNDRDHVWQKLENVCGPTGFHNYLFDELREDIFSSIATSAYTSNERDSIDLRPKPEFGIEEETMDVLPIASASSRMWFPAGSQDERLRPEFEGIKLPTEVMDKIVKKHVKSLKAFVKLASTSKRMSDFVFSIKDIELVGDDQEGTSEEYLCFPSYVGILKCVGIFDPLKIEPETRFNALKASTLRALYAFRTFTNLKKVSLTFPPLRGEMDDFTGYFWKTYFKGGMYWFIFMSPLSVTPPEGVNNGRAEPNRKIFEMDVTTMRKKLDKVCMQSYANAIAGASMMCALVTQLPHLEMISIIGKDERRIGNIYLHGDKLNEVRAMLQDLGGGGYNISDYTHGFTPRNRYIPDFTSPETRYSFADVTVFLLKGGVKGRDVSCEELLNRDTRARDGETLIESAYMELLRFVVDNEDLMEQGMGENIRFEVNAANPL